MKSKSVNSTPKLQITLTLKEVREIMDGMGQLYQPKEGSAFWSWPNSATAQLNHTLVGFSNDNI